MINSLRKTPASSIPLARLRCLELKLFDSVMVDGGPFGDRVVIICCVGVFVYGGVATIPVGTNFRGVLIRSSNCERGDLTSSSRIVLVMRIASGRPALNIWYTYKVNKIRIIKIGSVRLISNILPLRQLCKVQAASITQRPCPFWSSSPFRRL